MLLMLIECRLRARNPVLNVCCPDIHVCRFAVAIAHMFAGPFTGCGINPARVLGTSVYGNIRDMDLEHFSRGC